MHPFVVPLFIGGLLSASIAIYGWKHRTSVGRSFVLLNLSVAWWSLCYALELMSVRLPSILLWIKLEYIAIACTPVLFLMFAIHYSGRGAWLNRRRVAALLVIPAAAILLVWTVPHHRLYYTDWWVQRSGDYVVFNRVQGLGYWVFTAYSYLLLLSALVLFGDMLRTSPQYYHHEILLVFVGSLTPWVANVIVNPLGLLDPPVDPTPLAFALTSVIAGLALFRYHFLDLLPAARSALVDSIGDAWIVLDEQDRVVDLNAAAQSLLGETEQAVARPAREVLGGWPELVEKLACGGHEAALADISRDGERHFELRQTPLRDSSGAGDGCLLVLREVTEQKQLEQRQEQLINELQGALGQIRTLSGLLPICAHCHKIRDDSGYWHRVEEYVEQHSQAQFTHGICPDCLHALYPQMFPADEQKPAP